MQDNTVLREQVRLSTRNVNNSTEAILAVNDWVYWNKGFAKNHNYFFLKTLGPTPIQVLRGGGDCADKSRLLSAMLAQAGISSGLVMVYPCANCSPIHTVVEAEYAGGRMVVDPVWNIYYPAGNGRYYGVRELAGTSLGPARILQLKQLRGETSKIWSMPSEEASFDYAAGINWRKNSFTGWIASLLRFFRIKPESVLRPRILEDPKLALWVLLLALAAGAIVVGFSSGLLQSRAQRRFAPAAMA